ncbi:RNA-binding protein [Martiniozyma asiatica (nom. inval.)]|nr:RNA-binding protein [Martiniozyma asiatica]
MVRLKTRYVLFQLAFPDSLNDCINEPGNQRVFLSTLSGISAGQLVGLLRLSIQKNFGDQGSALVQTTFSVKYFSQKTGVGIIRCHREAVDLVMAAMFFITSIDGRECIMSGIGISGSIKKAEVRAVNRARALIKMVKAKGLQIDIQELQEVSMETFNEVNLE